MAKKIKITVWRHVVSGKLHLTSGNGVMTTACGTQTTNMRLHKSRWLKKHNRCEKCLW